MPQISPIEIFFVALVALIVLGPEKLPGIARSIGRALNEARRMASEVRAEFESGMAVEDEQEFPQQQTATDQPPDDSKGSGGVD